MVWSLDEYAVTAIVLTWVGRLIFRDTIFDVELMQQQFD
tara:strand:- start:1126 stop:1242 length:117 start_codon:yes stop_codon:yes gene_type:complete